MDLCYLDVNTLEKKKHFKVLCVKSSDWYMYIGYLHFKWETYFLLK